MALIGTAAGGIGVAFSWNMTYVPEFIFYNHAGAQLTSMRVSTQEDGVIADFTGAMLTAVTGFMKMGAVTANDISVRLADGNIKGKNVTISGVTSAVGAISFFGCGDNKGTSLFKWSQAAILAGNATEFKKFTAIWAPTMATATDYADVSFADGHQERFEIEDLQHLSSQYQEVQGIILNNVDGTIQKAVFRCAAATPAYILSVLV